MLVNGGLGIFDPRAEPAQIRLSWSPESGRCSAFPRNIDLLPGIIHSAFFARRSRHEPGNTAQIADPRDSFTPARAELFGRLRLAARVRVVD